MQENGETVKNQGGDRSLQGAQGGRAYPTGCQAPTNEGTLKSSRPLISKKSSGGFHRGWRFYGTN